MKEDRIRAAVLRVLSEVAPEADTTALDPAVSFRDQIEFDSMDFVNFVLALNRELSIDVAEVDYPKLSSLDGCVACLAAKAREDAGS